MRTELENKKDFPIQNNRTVDISEGYFACPFPMRKEKARRTALLSYQSYFLNKVNTNASFARAVEELRGKILICDCPPKPCHGNIILQYLEYRGEDGDAA